MIKLILKYPLISSLLGIFVAIILAILVITAAAQVRISTTEGRAKDACSQIHAGQDFASILNIASAGGVDLIIISSENDEVIGGYKKGSDTSEINTKLKNGAISFHFYTGSPKVFMCIIKIENKKSLEDGRFTQN